MATVTQSNIGNLHEKITVTLTAQDYTPGFTAALKSYAKQANIPGFRKGMVPAGMVKKMYGPNVFGDEVLRLAAKELEDYLRSNKIDFIGRAIPVSDGEPFGFDMNDTKDYNFHFEIGINPTFTIPAIDKGQNVEQLVPIVSDEMINEEVEKAVYRHGKMEDVDSVTDDDDVLHVTFNAANATDGEAGIKNNLLVRYFSDSVKSELMGKKTGDSIAITLGTAFDSKVAKALYKDLKVDIDSPASDALQYNMLIDKTVHVTKAVMDAGLYADAMPGRNINSETEFRDALKNDIQAYWNQQSTNKLHNDIFEILVHETPIELPVDFLKRYLKEGGEELKTDEEVEKGWGSFEHSFRWQLLCNKIAKEFQLSASDDEMRRAVEGKVLSYFQQMGMSAVDTDEEWVRNLVDKQMKDKKYMDEAYNDVMTFKTFAVLEDKLTIQQKEVSLDEFLAAPAAHHHHH